MFCVEGSAITSLCRPQRLIMGKLRHDKARGGVGVAYFLLCRMHMYWCTVNRTFHRANPSTLKHFIRHCFSFPIVSYGV